MIWRHRKINIPPLKAALCFENPTVSLSLSQLIAPPPSAETSHVHHHTSFSTPFQIIHIFAASPASFLGFHTITFHCTILFHLSFSLLIIFINFFVFGAGYGGWNCDLSMRINLSQVVGRRIQFINQWLRITIQSKSGNCLSSCWFVLFFPCFYISCLINIVSGWYWSWSNSGEGHKSNEKLPKVNWLQHVNAIDNFSCQDKFLSSSFLFSLEPQKPPTEGAMGSRYDML